MKRTSTLLVSEDATQVPVTGRELHGCNCYASGERHFAECVVVRAWDSMLAWFKMGHAVRGFAELEMEPPTVPVEGEVVEIVR